MVHLIGLSGAVNVNQQKGKATHGKENSNMNHSSMEK